MQFRSNCASCFVFLMNIRYGTTSLALARLELLGMQLSLPYPYLIDEGFIVILLACFSVIYSKW